MAVEWGQFLHARSLSHFRRGTRQIISQLFQPLDFRTIAKKNTHEIQVLESLCQLKAELGIIDHRVGSRPSQFAGLDQAAILAQSFFLEFG